MKAFDKSVYTLLCAVRNIKSLDIINKIGMIDDYNIIVPNLYLGNFKMASNIEFLNKNNIKGIVNCTKDISFDKYFSDKDKLRISITDSKETDNINLFKENIINSIEFIDTCLEENKPVYVHCYYGLMRSATVVAAYLIKKYKIPKDLAIILVKEQRPRALSSIYNFNEILTYVENKYKIKIKNKIKNIVKEKNENEDENEDENKFFFKNNDKINF
jgi:protein-tyrosine phosphatase